MMSCFKPSFHNPNSTKSSNKCLLTTINSPDNTRRVYILEVYGSKHSLLPNICEVLAVGIGATNNEFLTPCFLTSLRSFAQSQRPLSSSSFIPQRLCWNSPLLIGEPW